MIPQRESNHERDMKDACGMHSDSNKLLSQLEHATSSGFIDPSKLDDETAMLREDWVALGRILQAAEPAPPAIQFSTQGIPPQDISEVKSPFRLRYIGAVLAIGLSLAGIWLGFQFGLFNQGPATHPQQTDLAERELPPREESERDQTPPKHLQVAPATGAQLAWDDGWENQVALTALAIEQLQGEQRTRDESISRLQDMFLEFSREFESGSL
jgi:hypothetical protein